MPPQCGQSGWHSTSASNASTRVWFLPFLPIQAHCTFGRPEPLCLLPSALLLPRVSRPQLSIKAIYKVREESDLTSSSVKSPGPSVKAFLAGAKAAAPSYAAEFDKLALRVQRQLVCGGEEQRLALLGDRDGYMSSVDLSAVHGGHHAVVAQGAVVDGMGV